MFNVYDSVEKKNISQFGWKIRCNADRVAQSKNVRQCGINEIEKPENERRFIVKEY